MENIKIEKLILSYIGGKFMLEVFTGKELKG